MFDAQVAELANQFRCISYDQRGQGLSSDQEAEEIDLDLLCADTIALIERLQLGAVHFCGHSLGGFVGLRLASRRPDLVRSLILCNTSGGAEPAIRRLAYKSLNFIVKKYGLAILAETLKPFIFGKSFLASNASASTWAECRRIITSNKPSIWHSGNATIYRPCQHQQLESIKAPTLIFTGTEDRLRTPAESRHLKASIPNATLISVDGGGHMLPIEHPKLVSDAIRDFVASIS